MLILYSLCKLLCSLSRGQDLGGNLKINSMIGRILSFEAGESGMLKNNLKNASSLEVVNVGQLGLIE